MDRKLQIVLGIVVLVVAFMWMKRGSAPLEDAEDAASPSARAQAERARAEREVIREMAPEAPELLDVPEGDVAALKEIARRRLGMDVKELRQNPDGSYDIKLATGEETKVTQAYLLDARYHERFRESFLEASNKGRRVIPDARDAEEIRRFRESLEPR